MSNRGNIVKRPDAWKRGQPVSARKLDQLRDGLDRLIEGTTTEQLRSEQRVFRQIFQAQIAQISGDYLDVREYREYPVGPPFVGTTQILVARPWLLRRSPFDGGSWNGIGFTYSDDQTRTATQAATTEVQRITPAYVIGDVIFCAGQVYGGVGVDQGGLALVALDMNVDGRSWAAEPQP